MLITHLTATENNGVVTAEFEAMGGKVKLQVSKAALVKFADKECLQEYANMLAVQFDSTLQLKPVEKWVSENLETTAHEFINYNLNDAQ